MKRICNWNTLPVDKINLIYSAERGIPCSDAKAEETAKKLKEQTLYVSTENVIHTFRLLIKRGFFTPNEVNVFFEQEKDRYLEVLFDKDGLTEDWYEGFCDTLEKVWLGLF